MIIQEADTSGVAAFQLNNNCIECLTSDFDGILADYHSPWTALPLARLDTLYPTTTMKMTTYTAQEETQQQ